jgi:serine/threonine protein kinase
MSLQDNDIEVIIGNKNTYFKVQNIREGSVFLNKKNKHLRIPGGLCCVYKYKLQDGSVKALRIWKTLISESKERSNEIAKHLKSLKSTYFVDFEYIEDAFLYNGVSYPVVLMEWCEGVKMKKYIDDNINDGQKIRELADNFLDMVRYFHKEGIAHGDLHHENIMVKDDGSIVVIDYDSMYVPSLVGYKDECGGYPGYQHPARSENEYLSIKLDYFSELIIYLSLILLSKKPELWTIEAQDFDKELLGRIEYLIQNEDLVDFSIPGVPWLITKLKMYMDFKTIDDLKPLEKIVDEIFPPKVQKVTKPVSYDDNEIKKITDRF